MRGRTIAAFAASVAVLVSIAAGTALAATTPTSGKIRLFVTTLSPTKDKVLVTGAVGDYGTALSENAKGKISPNGDFEQLKLKHGDFVINATGLDIELNHAKPQINKATCSVVFSATGSGTLEDGTGAYTGIAGKLTIIATFAGIAPKTAKGCNLANNAPTYGFYQSIAGTGTVHFT